MNTQNITFDPSNHAHRRYNPLTGRYVLVSPRRTERPWLGQQEEPAGAPGVAYDPSCYLCSGNQRASGKMNPEYSGTYVFDNDFATLTPPMPQMPTLPDSDDPLFRIEQAVGVNRVLCFSPDHSKTLPELSLSQISTVIEAWCDQAKTLGRDYRWVQIFENKGEMMGCSNPHPHCQIWATRHLPNDALLEDRRQHQYYQAHHSPMLLDYALRESRDGARTVVENQHWIAVVPYWAAWPFETLLLPKTAVTRLFELNPSQRDTLAETMKKLTSRYDNLFQSSFPYSMGWHGAPTEMDTGTENAPSAQRPEMPEFADFRHWQLHAHYYPPLLRSATIRKHMVGYEMLAEPQRDLTPEQAAERLRALSDRHFREA